VADERQTQANSNRGDPAVTVVDAVTEGVPALDAPQLQLGVLGEGLFVGLGDPETPELVLEAPHTQLALLGPSHAVAPLGGDLKGDDDAPRADQLAVAGSRRVVPADQ
jgi:hypothetical protein